MHFPCSSQNSNGAGSSEFVLAAATSSGLNRTAVQKNLLYL